MADAPEFDDNEPIAPLAQQSKPAAPEFDDNEPIEPLGGAPAPIAPALTAQQRYRQSLKGYHDQGTENPDVAPGYVSPETSKAFAEAKSNTSSLGSQWGDVGIGAAKGLAGGVSGGWLGDIESIGRLPFQIPGVRENIADVSPHTAIPTSEEGGYLGPRGLGAFNAPETPEEKGGAFIGSMLSPNVISGGAKAVGKGIKHIAGQATFVGPKALEIAYSAGKEGGEAAQAFRENITKSVDLADIIPEVKSSIDNMRAARNAGYVSDMKELGKNVTPLNFDEIDKAVARSTQVKTFKGQDLSPATTKIRQEMNDAIKEWRSLDPAEYHTPVGMDALKQKLGDFMENTLPRTPERVVASDIYNAVRQTIIKEAPEYAPIMKAYENSSAQIKEIEKALSLGNNASADTGLRKLQSILRDNVNASYGSREQLAKYLIANGSPHLMEKLAGQSLSPYTPRGLGKLAQNVGAHMAAIAAAASTGGVAPILTFMAGVPISSPRLMGNLSYLSGVAARYGEKIPAKAAIRTGILADTVTPDGTQPRATGGSVFDKMHMARKRAEGGGTDAPFNEWDAVPRNAEGIPQIRIEKPQADEARTLANMLGAPAGEDAAFWNLLRGENTGENPYGSADYETKLTADEEPAYAAWKARTSPNDSGQDYDLRGAFKAGLERAGPEAGIDEGHFPDKFKKPTHPTFSDQSQYAANAPSKAGTWDGDTYVPHKTADALWPATKLEAEVQQPPMNPFFRAAASLLSSGPFKDAAVASQGVGGALKKTASDAIMLPGEVMKLNPYESGSEMAGYHDAQKFNDEVKWAADMAINTAGTGGMAAFTPGRAGGVYIGAGGGKAKIPEPKALANALEQPNAPTFYSALDRAVADIPQAKAPAEQWAATLANRPGVKPEEIQWRGLDQYLAGRQGQTVTKQEIADHLAGNKVEFGSVVKGGKEPFDAKRLSQLESEYSSLKQHPIDDPSFGEAKYDELIRLMNIRDQSTTDTLYSAAKQAENNGQRAQQRGNKIAADRYFKEYEMLNRRAEKLDLEGLGLANPPKYSGYQLPGGENYSEKLLTLPNQWEAPRAAQVANEAKIKALRQEMHGTSGTNEIRAEIRSLQDANAALQKQISASPIYKSPHWDEPNPVTHMRTNERTIGNTASHHIEEVQSDWHQKGRTEGYADPDPAKRDIAARELLTAESELKKQIRRSDQSHYKEAIDNQVEFHANPERDVEFAEQWFGPEQQSAALRYMAAKREFSALAGGVPDAPFKKTWPDLTMKQALRDAVENGKDRLSWTPGEAQAKRYDLSQQVDHIKVEGVTEAPGVHFVDIKLKSGPEINLDVENGVIREGKYKGKPLAVVVGKEMAEKITSVESGHKKFTGENLNIGGEGMNEFYDKMLPKAVEKLGKAYGVKVQRGVDTTGNPVNYVDIPPAWKQEILKKGFPLFASGGSVFDKMKRASK